MYINSRMRWLEMAGCAFASGFVRSDTGAYASAPPLRRATPRAPRPFLTQFRRKRTRSLRQLKLLSTAELVLQS